jgi:hypothetical protein
MMVVNILVTDAIDFVLLPLAKLSAASIYL